MNNPGFAYQTYLNAMSISAGYCIMSQWPCSYFFMFCAVHVVKDRLVIAIKIKEEKIRA